MLGERFKELRKQKGLSQKELANLLSCSSGFISEIEQGNKKPGSDILISLKRALCVNIDWLLTGEGEPYIKTEANSDELAKISNVIELQYMNLVRSFTDKQRALNINRELIELEKMAPEIFRSVESYIKGTVDTVRQVTEKPFNNQDRRNQQRRKENKIPPEGQDRRSGTDRRKAGGRR